jgi:hypothetical protein
MLSLLTGPKEFRPGHNWWVAEKIRQLVSRIISIAQAGIKRFSTHGFAELCGVGSGQYWNS